MTETGSQFLDELETIIQQRLAEGGEQSYTAQLVASGETRVAEKVGEEAVEVALAAVSGNRDELVEEAADLFGAIISDDTLDEFLTLRAYEQLK